MAMERYVTAHVAYVLFAALTHITHLTHPPPALAMRAALRSRTTAASAGAGNGNWVFARLIFDNTMARGTVETGFT